MCVLGIWQVGISIYKGAWASTDGSVHMSLYSSATQTSTSFFSRIQIEGGSGMTCRIKGAHIVTHSSPVQSVDSHNCHINLRLLICTDNAEQHTGTLLTTVVCRGVLPRHLFFLKKTTKTFLSSKLHCIFNLIMFPYQMAVLGTTP